MFIRVHDNVASILSNSHFFTPPFFFFAQSCDYAFTLPNVAFLASTTTAGLDGFLAGARENILAGGDSGSRGCFLGAIAGARLQDKTLLPADWAQKTTILPTVRTLAAALVAQRSSSSGSSSSGGELLL